MTRSRYYESALKEAQLKNGDIRKAYGLLIRGHKAKDDRATYALATWYLFGRENVIEKDLKRAVGLLRESALANNADALHDLAVCYAKGAGVRKSDSKAAQLYVQAAIYGDKQSAYEVGRCYWHGIGVKRDRKIARVWLNHADQFSITK